MAKRKATKRKSAKWTPEMRAKATRLAAAQFTLQEIADMLGVTREVVKRRMTGDTAFSDAIHSGRPKWEPTDEQLEQIGKLAMMQCDLEEIAGWVGVSPSTIDRRMKDHPEFRVMIESGRKKGSASFKRLCWKHAEDKQSKACGKALGLLGAKFDMGENLNVTVVDYRSRLNSMLNPVDDEDLGGDATPASA